MRMIILFFIFILNVSASAMADQSPATALMDWQGRNPVDGESCRFQVFDISLNDEGQVQFLSQLRFENPFLISPRIWLVQIAEDSDFYAGRSDDQKFNLELYTRIPEATLPEIETIKLTIKDGDSLYSHKCSTYGQTSF